MDIQTAPIRCCSVALPRGRAVRSLPPLLVVVLIGCAAAPIEPGDASPTEPTGAPMYAVRATDHRDGDDLLSGGLGLAGLRAPTPPAVADPAAPTAAELRRRALWTNWRGIADLSPAGRYGEAYGAVPTVPGREFSSLMRLPEANAPHRVLLQLPDAFDATARCLLVAASSGSRGVYGAISLAGAWGLPRGCAVVYTDKGAGTDLFDAASGAGYGIDGRLDTAATAFRPEASSTLPLVAYKHAHSQDNPEADWGRHVQQAARFGLDQLSAALPALAPFTVENTRIIAVGLSNGGGAVLRAAELPDDGFDGVVAIAPNVLPGEGGRALYDYASEAALWMTCAQAATALADAPLPLPQAAIDAQRQQACGALVAEGEVRELSAAADAHAYLRDRGWTDAALRAGMLSTAFDLWHSVGVTYASAYLRRTFDAMPCGVAFAAVDAAGQPRAAGEAERALWWSDGSGIGPGGGVKIVERATGGSSIERLRCLRQLWTTDTDDARQLRASVAATRAGLPRAGLPVLVVHGQDDGLVPEAFSGGAYAAWVKHSGAASFGYWRVGAAQHFDTFLALPTFARRYVPLLPYGYAALDAMWQHLERGVPLQDRVITPGSRAAADGGAVALTADLLRLPPR